MKTHDQKTKDHIKAIALAFAEDPESVTFHASPAPDLGCLHDDPFSYFIRPKSEPIAPGHNPDGLTVEQVGEGWRLLEKDEIRKHGDDKRWVQMFIQSTRVWNDRACGDSKEYTYRTRLSREQLALLDKNEGWIPWFGKGEIPTGMVEYCVRNEGVNPSLDERSEAEQLDWTITNEGRDIIAYRPAKQPTVVPWTRETIPALPFEVVHKPSGDRTTLIAGNPTVVTVANYGGQSYISLLEMFTLPNGEPCGVKGEK